MKELAKILINKKLTISTAESCTAGSLSAKLTSIAGSSAYFDCGFVTYSNKAKMNFLNVQKETLKDFGAVSEEVVKQMVLGLIDKSQTNIGIAISGIAGPSGATDTKKVGTVCFGFFFKNKVIITTQYFHGNRAEVIKQSVTYAINKTKQIVE